MSSYLSGRRGERSLSDPPRSPAASVSPTNRSRARRRPQQQHKLHSGFSSFFELVHQIQHVLDSSRWNNYDKKKKKKDGGHEETAPLVDLYPILGKLSLSSSSSKDHDDDHLPSSIGNSGTAEEQHHDAFHENISFLRKLLKVIYVLGLEVGILAQGSTVGIQFVATRYMPNNRSSQLVLSFLWSYVLAMMALLLFFVCHKVVRIFLRELLKMYFDVHQHSPHPHGSTTNNNNQHFNNHNENSNDKPHDVVADESKFRQLTEEEILEEWRVELQCNFVQGTIVGIFFSWLFVDMCLNFRTQVIYGGIVLVLSLFFFTLQLWCRQCQLDRHAHTQVLPHDKGQPASAPPRQQETA